MIRKRILSLFMAAAFSLSIASASAFASPALQTSPVMVKDLEGNQVDLAKLKPLMNYHKVDFNILKEKMNQSKSKPMDKLSALSTSPYGHAWTYIQLNDTGVNCYCYSIKLPWWMNPGDGDGVSDLTSQSAVDNYFKNVNVVANAVIADGNTNQLYLKGNPPYYPQWRTISSATASINSDEHRIAVRVGWVDANRNGHVDDGEADYHFMVQTSSGGWAEKHGQQPSIYDGNINPSTFSWNLGSYKNFYNSPTVYIAAKVW